MADKHKFVDELWKEFKRIEEKGVEDAAELNRLRGLFKTNFVNYNGCPPDRTYVIWDDVDEFNKLSLYEIILHSFDYIFKIKM